MILFERLGIDIGYILLGMIGIIFILLILLIIILVRQSKLKKVYNKFMSGSNGESLETEITGRFADLDNLKVKFQETNKKIKEIEEALSTSYQKIGIVKYDAFKEMGGKLSFSIALLNEMNDGFILNSMHSSREGCYTYIKEIIKGESFVMLAEEEKTALDIAKNRGNLME